MSSQIVDKSFYNPSNIKFIFINQLLKELNLAKFIGWKLLIPDVKWTFDIGIKCPEINNIPYIGKGIKIFRNHSTDMNQWKISEESAKEFKIRIKRLNPYVKAKIDKINNNLLENIKNIEEYHDKLNRRYLADYVNQRIAFVGDIIHLSARKTYDRNHRCETTIVTVTIGNVVTEYGESMHHINAMYTKDVYMKNYSHLNIDNHVQCVGTVVKYIGENKYGVRNVFINVIK